MVIRYNLVRKLDVEVKMVVADENLMGFELIGIFLVGFRWTSTVIVIGGQFRWGCCWKIWNQHPFFSFCSPFFCSLLFFSLKLSSSLFSHLTSLKLPLFYHRFTIHDKFLFSLIVHYFSLYFLSFSLPFFTMCCFSRSSSILTVFSFYIMLLSQ